MKYLSIEQFKKVHYQTIWMQGMQHEFYVCDQNKYQIGLDGGIIIINFWQFSLYFFSYTLNW